MILTCIQSTNLICQLARSLQAAVVQKGVSHIMECLNPLFFLAGAIIGMAATSSSQVTKPHALTEVYHNDDFQLIGVTVSKSGRIFVNFPRWSDKYLNAVVEIMLDGSARPFPDERWNRWDLKPQTAGKRFVCVQSVVVDDADALWVLDPAAPMLKTAVPGGPKLVRIDLKTNRVSRSIPFGPNVASPKSYLNDVRFDTRRNTAYITDSGVGGIVIVDLVTGKAHRALDGHASVMAEQGVGITINGKPVLDSNGKPPTVYSDGIALSPNGEYLYYQALTGATLCRVRTDALREAKARPDAVAAAVEKVAETFPVDGLWMDSKERIYLSGLNQNAVIRLLPDRTMETLVTDERLQWPDTFGQGPDGAIYVATSHIHESPAYNNGKSVRKRPYAVFKFKP